MTRPGRRSRTAPSATKRTRQSCPRSATSPRTTARRSSWRPRVIAGWRSLVRLGGPSSPRGPCCAGLADGSVPTWRQPPFDRRTGRPANRSEEDAGVRPAADETGDDGDRDDGRDGAAMLDLGRAPGQLRDDCHDEAQNDDLGDDERRHAVIEEEVPNDGVRLRLRAMTGNHAYERSEVEELCDRHGDDREFHGADCPATMQHP